MPPLARPSHSPSHLGLALCFADGECEPPEVFVPTGDGRFGTAYWPFERSPPARGLAEHAVDLALVDGRLHAAPVAGVPLWLNGAPGGGALSAGDVVRVGGTLLVAVPAERDAPVAQTSLGRSAAMRAVRHSVDLVAPRPHTVVVLGETGTGKEIVARAIHEASGRRGPFVAVNCSTFSESLLASDLFGHVRGAFTGATSDHPGLFRAARGGTLLLDELADMPTSLQGHLLRVLETREVRPVGGTTDVPIDVRVIATTNRPLAALVQEGRFRADLYARLAQWTIPLPPLRERREDVPELAAALLLRCDGAGRRVDVDLAEELLLHEWPLNVRGLLNVLSVAVVACPAREPLGLAPEVRTALASTRGLGTGAPPRAPAPPSWPDRAGLEGLIGRFDGRVAAAARELGVNRTTLYRRLWAAGLDPASFRRPRTAR